MINPLSQKRCQMSIEKLFLNVGLDQRSEIKGRWHNGVNNNTREQLYGNKKIKASKYDSVKASIKSIKMLNIKMGANS